MAYTNPATRKAWLEKNRIRLNAKIRARLAADPELRARRRETQRAWCAANRERVRIAKRKSRAKSEPGTHHRKCRYGISADDFKRMVARQGGKCAVCQVVPRKFCVDHNHTTGQVRGLLCYRCNIGVGHVERADFVDQARAYLRNYEPI